MPKLKNGNEYCDTCGLPYIPPLKGVSCECPYQVVIEHKGKEAETALSLKYRQRARDAEEALKVSDKQNEIMKNSLLFMEQCNPASGDQMMVVVLGALKSIKKIQHKQLEDILTPTKGGEDGKIQGRK